MSNLTIDEILSVFVDEIKFNTIPLEVIDQAKRCILDTLGVIIGGYNTSEKPDYYMYNYQLMNYSRK